jgi:hypothetical protein
MITLRRADQRHHDQNQRRERWITFDHRKPADPLCRGFGTLEVLNEYRLGPSAELPAYPHDHDAEVFIWVHEGTLAFTDSSNHLGLITAGEIQRLTHRRGQRRHQCNASRTEEAHFFEIGIRPLQHRRESGHAQRRIGAAERRGALSLVASRDGRRDSLTLHQEASIYSALLEPGQHIVLELLPARRAWLHLIQGEVAVGDLVLTTGDGAGVVGERSVSFTAMTSAEIVLFDVGDPP